jgi:hypothetical protein
MKRIEPVYTENALRNGRVTLHAKNSMTVAECEASSSRQAATIQFVLIFLLLVFLPRDRAEDVLIRFVQIRSIRVQQLQA